MNAASRAADLGDVPETMLWTLYGRASEAARPGGVLEDPDAQGILRSISYPFRLRFGLPQPVFALRSLAFDHAVEGYLRRFPGAQIASLGEGLETQRFRVRDDYSHWLTVDLPEAIAVRERYIAPDHRHQHLSCSATDARWMRELSADTPTIVVAQGLFMYLDPSAVRDLLRAMAHYFRSLRVVFDVVPAWVSRSSTLARGLPLTPFYRIPPMPWGIARYAVKPTLRRWLGQPLDISFREYPILPRGPVRAVSRWLPALPLARQWLPAIVEVETRSAK